LENLNGKNHSEDLGVDEEDNIRLDLRKRGWEGVERRVDDVLSKYSAECIILYIPKIMRGTK
jgi:hypothetical protein